MWNALSLRHYIILSQNSLALGFSVIGGVIVLLLGPKNASPSLLLVWDIGYRITIIIQHNLLVRNYFDMIRIPFPIIFSLQGGK